MIAHSVLFLQLLLFPFNAFIEKDPDAILGKWKTVQKNLIVEVFKINDEYRAKVVWFKNTEGNSKPIHDWVDEHNPDKSLRERKILNMEILTSMNYNPKENRWEKGKIYDSSSGREYSSSAWLGQNNKLMVRGFLHFEFLGKTMVFEKL